MTEPPQLGGFCQFWNLVESEIEPTERATAEAEQFGQEHEQDELVHRVERVERLIDGFQSPYGMELLAVHWVATRCPLAHSVEEAVAAVAEGNDRKKLVLQRNHLISVWQRLADEGWIPQSTPQLYAQYSPERRLGNM